MAKRTRSKKMRGGAVLGIDIKGEVSKFIKGISKFKEFATKVAPALSALPPSMKPSGFLKSITAPSSGYTKSALEEARDGLAEALGSFGLGRRRRRGKGMK